MTDAHCHILKGAERYWLAVGYLFQPEWPRTGTEGENWLFYGVHPWDSEKAGDDFVWLKERLEAESTAGVGEIGLDRLKEREISPKMRQVFDAQLKIAAEYGRVVVLHGAKCWGQVVKAAKPYAKRIPAFIFHGFSRSDGLLNEMMTMGGYVSVGPAVLNDHAVNYRALVKRIPGERLLVESDRTEATADGTPDIETIARKVAEVRGEDWTAFRERLEKTEKTLEGLK